MEGFHFRCEPKDAVVGAVVQGAHAEQIPRGYGDAQIWVYANKCKHPVKARGDFRNSTPGRQHAHDDFAVALCCCRVRLG